MCTVCDPDVALCVCVCAHACVHAHQCTNEGGAGERKAGVSMVRGAW